MRLLLSCTPLFYQVLIFSPQSDTNTSVYVEMFHNRITLGVLSSVTAMFSVRVYKQKKASREHCKSPCLQLELGRNSLHKKQCLLQQ